MSSADSPETSPRRVKSASAFRTISEVSDDLDVPQHVLRFWETKFAQVSPMKRGGGRRYYRPEDVDLLRRIRDLLYSDGYTIKGVQKLLRETRGRLDGVPGQGLASGQGGPPPQAGQATAPGALAPALDANARSELQSILKQLEALKQKLSEAI